MRVRKDLQELAFSDNLVPRARVTLIQRDKGNAGSRNEIDLVKEMPCYVLRTVNKR